MLESIRKCHTQDLEFFIGYTYQKRKCHTHIFGTIMLVQKDEDLKKKKKLFNVSQVKLSLLPLLGSHLLMPEIYLLA